MIGPRLAERIRTRLSINSLEEVYAAAYDGRLRRVAGVGRKRVQAIRESLSVRLDRQPPTRREYRQADQPPLEVLLEIDRLYRERAAAGRLITVAPRRFNPTGAAWLPILRIKRHGHRYCAMFANTARSHDLDRTHDWVVIYREGKDAFGIWTVLTSQFGLLRGKRIVRGREAECSAYYESARPVQLSLLSARSGRIDPPSALPTPMTMIDSSAGRAKTLPGVPRRQAAVSRPDCNLLAF